MERRKERHCWPFINASGGTASRHHLLHDRTVPEPVPEPGTQAGQKEHSSSLEGKLHGSPQGARRVVNQFAEAMGKEAV